MRLQSFCRDTWAELTSVNLVAPVTCTVIGVAFLAHVVRWWCLAVFYGVQL